MSGSSDDVAHSHPAFFLPWRSVVDALANGQPRAKTRSAADGKIKIFLVDSARPNAGWSKIVADAHTFPGVPLMFHSVPRRIA
jgi:hypothetical protein